MRSQSLVSITTAPSNHTNAITVAFLATPNPTSPIRPIGLAHESCCAQSRSITAPSGKKKLNAVATQIQYFAVALPLRSDVRTHAALQAIEAYRR
jgi:hypothetical protein